MPRAHYAVIPDGARWQINVEGKNYGPFPSQDAALRAAVDTAQKAGKGGFEARVMVQDKSGGAFRVHWTYGTDPYPPTLV